MVVLWFFPVDFVFSSVYKINMIQKISEPVSVATTFDAQRKKITPRWLIWQGRLHPIIRLGLHHTFRRGRTLYHVFSVSSRSLFFRLVLNTENLHWQLEEISDGLAE